MAIQWWHTHHKNEGEKRGPRAESVVANQFKRKKKKEKRKSVADLQYLQHFEMVVNKIKTWTERTRW